MSAWQPIETAPKEGYILVYGGIWQGDWAGGNEPPDPLISLVDAKTFYHPHGLYYSTWINNPTHWQPLPPPPAADPQP